MKRIFPVAVAVIAAAAVFSGIWFFFRDSDEKRIRRTLTELCDMGSKSSGENPAVSALKSNRADHVFAPKCHFDFGLNAMDGVLTPTEIGARLLRIRSMFQWIKLDFSDLSVSVAGEEARVFFSGSLKGRIQHGNAGEVDEIREIDGELARQPDGRWKFIRMSFRQILEK